MAGMYDMETRFLAFLVNFLGSLFKAKKITKFGVC